jgi:hypothetical protein
MGLNAKIWSVVLSGVLGLTAWAGMPTTAEACGGFFCNGGGGGGGPQPVVQAAERVIFEKHDDGTIRAYVQIRYDGIAPVGFSWIIPVLGIPEVGIGEAATFDQLDGATNPQFRFINRAATGFSGGGGSGMACGASDASGSRAAPGSGFDSMDVEGVTIWDSSRVGDYETATLSGESAEQILDWLTANGYDIPAEAGPLLEDYVTEGHLFVSFKYAPVGVGTGTLDPVVLTYRGEKPCVPLRITALASTPILDIMVLAFGPARAVPDGTYNSTEPDFDSVRQDFSITNGTTYGVEVARSISDAGGQAFVTEYAAPSDTLAGAVTDVEAQAILDRNPYVTRFYTRMAPEDMTADPEFIFPGGEDVPRFHVIDITPVTADASSSISELRYAAAPGLLLAAGIALVVRRRRRRR